MEEEKQEDKEEKKRPKERKEMKNKYVIYGKMIKWR